MANILPTSSTVEGVGYAYEASEIQKKEGYKGAAIPGSHMEGPFLSPENIPGLEAQDADILPPSIETFDQFWKASHGQVRLVDSASTNPALLS